MYEEIGEEFIEKTKYRFLQVSDQQKGLPQPPLEIPFEPSKRLTNLPTPQSIQTDPIDVRKAIENRRSIREYSSQPLTLGELSFLLWCTQGVKQVTGRPATSRTVPSAGARHALETYLLVNRVEGLQLGLLQVLGFGAQAYRCQP